MRFVDWVISLLLVSPPVGVYTFKNVKVFMFTFLRVPYPAILSVQSCFFVATVAFSSSLLAFDSAPEQLEKMVITAHLQPIAEYKIGSAITVITAFPYLEQRTKHVRV